MDWSNVDQVLALPIAQDWSKPFRARVAAANGWRSIHREASRATIEALTRKLRTRKWLRKHSSRSRFDGRADSRYYQAPNNIKFVIRISNHAHPNVSGYNGAKDYIITETMMEQYNVLGLIKLVETDEKAFNFHLRRHTKRRSD